MVFQPTPGNGVIDNPTIEISHEGLRSLLNQIEAELMESEVYRRTMAGLQTMLGEASSTAQILVKAVGREAVRLTFQQFSQQYKIVPIGSEDTNQAKQDQFNSFQIVTDNPVQVESQFPANTVEEVAPVVETTKQPTLANKFSRDKKRTKPELPKQKVVQRREEILRQIGQELRQAREARLLSLDQLHRQTLIPLHHIEALESGCLEHLPEDVYIRGFIRRLGVALGLNGVAMAASIPEPDPVKSVVPSWYHPTAAPGFHLPGLQLSSVHLYLGYTALIAGAVGGLSWMSQRSTPGTSVKPQPANPSEVSASPKAQLAQPTNKPGLKSSQTGVKKAGQDIAPPEALPF
jgi:ribosome-binding protein aMBF1 (putative translation factor)